MATAFMQWMRQAGAGALDFVLPPLCGLCRAEVTSVGALCSDCWKKLKFLAPPWCRVCGVPFALAEGAEAVCPVCLVDPPPYSMARAALSYDEASRELVSHFKYRDQLHLLPLFKPWLVRVGDELRAGVDVVAPVPLHWSRFLTRRYNQAALLAGALELPIEFKLLKRTKRTRPQVGLPREERAKNVKKAFAVTDDVAGKTVLLVDDVLTTGATLSVCSEALLAAGAKEIRVLTLARVVTPQHLV